MAYLNDSTGPDGFRTENTGKISLNYGYFVVLFAFIIIVVQWGVFHSFGIYFTSMISEFG